MTSDQYEIVVRQDDDSIVEALLTRGHRRVSLAYIGEGWDGDYDEDRPYDERLLRFDIQEFVDGEWEAMDDGSYCTGLTVDAPHDHIRKALLTIMDETFSLDRVKKVGERLSWLV